MSFYMFLHNCPQSLGVNGAVEIPGIVFGDFVKKVCTNLMPTVLFLFLGLPEFKATLLLSFTFGL